MIDNEPAQRNGRQRLFAKPMHFLHPAILISLLIAALLVIPIATTQTALAAASTGKLGNCTVFPANNVWNYDISKLPVDPNSANYVKSMGLSAQLTPYFSAPRRGHVTPGITYTTVTAAQPYMPTQFYYANQSDPGPYPIPANASIEGGPNSIYDRHVVVINESTCKLYELYRAFPHPDGSWSAASGAAWDLNSNALRPLNWTSADAAGLPIFPALVRYDEVASGVIAHALRVTTTSSQCRDLWPARHVSSLNCNSNLPPMGLRLRLKASINISSFPPDMRVILTALKHYGMFVADNGPKSWVISGAPDPHWNVHDLSLLRKITGADFEAVNEAALQYAPDSGQVNPAYYPSTSAPRTADYQSASLSSLLPMSLPMNIRETTCLQ